MDPKQKATENIRLYLDKRVKKNELKLLEYRDREKVYGFRYENKKDVIHAENEFIDNLLRVEALIAITEHLGFEVEQVYEAYCGKNKVNYQRLESGY